MLFKQAHSAYDFRAFDMRLLHPDSVVKHFRPHSLYLNRMQVSVTFTCDLDSVATPGLCLSRATVTTQRIPVSTHMKLGHHRPTIETQLECIFACVTMVVRDGMLARIIGRNSHYAVTHVRNKNSSIQGELTQCGKCDLSYRKELFLKERILSFKSSSHFEKVYAIEENHWLIQ